MIYLALYIIVIIICLYFISLEMWHQDKLIATIIIVQAIALYIFLALMPGERLPENYATSFLGNHFIIDLLICATPSILIIGIISIIQHFKK